MLSQVTRHRGWREVSSTKVMVLVLQRTQVWFSAPAPGSLELSVTPGAIIP